MRNESNNISLLSAIYEDNIPSSVGRATKNSGVCEGQSVPAPPPGPWVVPNPRITFQLNCRFIIHPVAIYGDFVSIFPLPFFRVSKNLEGFLILVLLLSARIGYGSVKDSFRHGTIASCYIRMCCLIANRIPLYSGIGCSSDPKAHLCKQEFLPYLRVQVPARLWFWLRLCNFRNS